jgi:hypothetical protein
VLPFLNAFDTERFSFTCFVMPSKTERPRYDDAWLFAQADNMASG